LRSHIFPAERGGRRSTWGSGTGSRLHGAVLALVARLKQQVQKVRCHWELLKRDIARFIRDQDGDLGPQEHRKETK
jgi:hypothetical protein